MSAPPGMPNLPNPDHIFSSWWPYIFAIAVGALYGLRQYLRGPQFVGDTDIKDKVFIVTGANSGIGQATATYVAKKGARVYLACRNETEGKSVAEEIRTKTKNENVEFMKCDLASFKSVKEFVENFKKKEKKLHVLINNAGVMMCPQEETEDKFERQFGVNYLGTFLLTELLLDILKSSEPSRIVNTTASASNLGEINFDDINMNKDYVPGQAYAQSKLAVTLYTIKLAEILKGTKVTVNVVNPGVVNSNGLRYLPFKANAFLRISFGLFIWYLVKTAADGAQTTLLCAISDTLDGVSGKQYKDCQEKAFDANTQDKKVRDKLYQESIRWTKLKKPSKAD